MASESPSTETATPSLGLALIPIAFLVVSMAVTLLVFGQDPHVALIASTVVAGLVARVAGHRWGQLEADMLRGVQIGLKAILILIVIGLLIASWIAGGVVPLLIDYGLSILSPRIFLPAACVICAVVSVSTGSSWTTAGTVGVALMGVGGGLGLPLPMVAGAVVSGSYFGDKMSPLSDSTNLAPAVTGGELFAHIRHMLWTTVPAFVVALILYAVCSLFLEASETSDASIAGIQAALRADFRLSPVLLLAPALVVVLSLLRVSALPSLLAATGVGVLFAVGLQGFGLGEVVGITYGGFVSESGNAEVDALLSRGGLESMMYAISLVLCALAFGGVMEGSGMIRAIATAILRRLHSRGGLVTATVGTCMGMNITAPDQYLAIIVPGRMYGEAFRQRGLAAKNLSRTIEDGGTVTSALVPWNTCGATMMQALAVSPFAFGPWAFFNYLTPLFAIAWAYLGIGQAPLEEESGDDAPGDPALAAARPEAAAARVEPS